MKNGLRTKPTRRRPSIDHGKEYNEHHEGEHGDKENKNPEV